MPLFVVVLLKRTIYNKETKRETENERPKNERNQSGHKKALKADSTLDPKNFLHLMSKNYNSKIYYILNFKNLKFGTGPLTTAYFFNLNK